MSKIALTPNSSGTGTFTLAAPNSNTSRTLTLPDSTGELLTTTGDGSGLTGVVSFSPVAVTGATPSLDVGSYNFFKQEALTANTTVSFNSVPTNANWRYSFEPALLGGTWDVSTASHLHRYYVSTQDSDPTSVFFKPDGLKMYIIGSDGDDVYEYDLDTAWDVTTAFFLQSFDVAAKENTPQGVFFKPDGTKMYVVGSNGDKVHEYNLGTAWNVTTASYLQFFSVAAQETTPRGIFFKPDGTKLYLVGQTNDSVYEYDLSTAWNVTTASYLRLFSVAAQETAPRGVFFKPDGTKMYVVGASGEDVNEYDLSTAWDISTAVFLQLFSVQDTAPEGIFFKPDGLKMYIVGSGGDSVYEYDLGTTSTITLPAALENNPTQILRGGTRVTYEFITADAGVTVTLIGEEIV